MTSTNDISPLRILRREWKRYKPHLPKSTSLPTMQLRSFDRPLFTCRRCGFNNTLIPLCLWCAWSSDDATKAFEASMPRNRRISAPARLSQHTSEKRSKHGMRTSMSSWSVIESSSEVHGESEDCVMEVPEDVKDRNTHDATVAKAISPPKRKLPSQADVRDDMVTAPLLRARRPLPVFFLNPNTHDMKSIPMDRSNNTLITPRPSIHTLSPVIVDLPKLSKQSPTKTLRRKKRMTILRQRSSCSLRTRASFSLADRSDPTSKASPAPANRVRIGTPARPYYSAIRKNMPISRPGSPLDNPSRTPSPSPYAIPLISSVTPSFRNSFTFTGSPPSSPGFSLSGETELHMALQRWRSQEAPGVPLEYRFLDTNGEKKYDSVRGRVKKLGKGLKDLVLGRV